MKIATRCLDGGVSENLFENVEREARFGHPRCALCRKPCRVSSGRPKRETSASQSAASRTVAVASSPPRGPVTSSIFLTGGFAVFALMSGYLGF